MLPPLEVAMARRVDRKHLTITGKHKDMEADDRHVTVEGGDDKAVIIVTQAYGPNGDSLIGAGDVTFDGYPAVSVGVRTGGKEGLVHLSPIHGDARKKADFEIEQGAMCELFCPVSGAPLDKVGEVEDGSGASYFALYLTPKLSRGEMVQITDVWGHFHSRIVDDMELISYWATTHEELDVD